MEPALARPRHEAIDDDDLLVHEWRVRQLTRLGIPWSLARAAAGHRGRRGTAGSAMIVRPPFPPVPFGLVQGGDAQ